jgi:hypothetical protein
MKTLISFLLVVTSHFAICQNGKYDISEVIEIDSTSKTELYNRAIEWFSKTYKSADKVIQHADKETGVIIGKALMKSYVKVMGSYNNAGFVYYTITISVKDNKYRYEINNVYHDRAFSSLGGSGGSLNNEVPACGHFNITKKYWETIKSFADKDIENIVNSLKTSMQLPSKKEDW